MNGNEFGRSATEQSAASDYARIAEAIDFLCGTRKDQPTLDDLADHLALSPGHAQRLFTRWAGISPKRFLQHLTIEDAKRRISKTADLLSVAMETGLSGPGRLHDLFVSMEALSPGEFKRAAAGVTLKHGIGETPFGKAQVAWCERGICRLDFLDASSMSPAALFDDPLLALASWAGDDAGAARLLKRVFDRDPPGAGHGLPLWIAGTNFQIQVWRALLAIPSGGLLSYRDVAAMIDKPDAARAVGNANAANPVAYLIPCHRVLRGTGEIGAYRWGSLRMKAMVGWEGARSPME